MRTRFSISRLHTYAFTLLELLVVVAIIALLLAAIIPAVNSLSKSGGRKAAVSNLLGAIEQARTQAIKDGQATYLTFPAQPTDGVTSIADNKIIDRYFYHSFAVFEDDPANPATPKQITNWKIFPTGISLRTEISFSSSNAAWTSNDFAFTPAGTQTQKFPFMKFDATGALVAPAPSWIGPIPLRLFEGFVTAAVEHPTTKANKDEVINITRLTGRAEYIP